MRIFKQTYILLTVLFFVACSSEEIENTAPKGKEVSVQFNLTSRSIPGSGTPTDPVTTYDVERFNHYWVVFTDGTVANKIVAIVKNNCELTELDEFSVTLSPGTYKVYAFANISDAYLEGLGLVKGSPMPDLSSTLFTPDNRFFGYNVTTLLPAETFLADYKEGNNQGIPMTSVNGHTVQVTNAVTVATSIEVVRMFAKLEFVFGNNTDADLTLRSQSISNLSVNRNNTLGFIPLYNDDSRTFSFLDGTPFKTLTHNYGSGLEIPHGTTNLSKSFYVLESKADAISNSFLLDFDVVEKGAAPTDATDYMRYALTDPNTLTAIRRNDWIRIPIVFSDWQMRLEARTYPPIGAYPEADIDKNESNEFVVKFDGGGEFSIRPYMRKFNDADNWFGIDNTAKVSGTTTISVDDIDGIFLTEPTITKTGEIRGKMKVASGKKACITITVNIITSAHGVTPITTKTLTRKIFVTQK